MKKKRKSMPFQCDSRSVGHLVEILSQPSSYKDQGHKWHPGGGRIVQMTQPDN